MIPVYYWTLILWVTIGTGFLFAIWIAKRELGILDSQSKMIDIICKYNTKLIKMELYDTHKLSYDITDRIIDNRRLPLKFWIPIRRIEDSMLLEIEKHKIVNRLINSKREVQ